VHAEAVKLAVADRQKYLGDPAFVESPAQRMLNEDFIAARRALILALPERSPNLRLPICSQVRRIRRTAVWWTPPATPCRSSKACSAEWGAAYVVPGTGAVNEQPDDRLLPRSAAPERAAPGKAHDAHAQHRRRL